MLLLMPRLPVLTREAVLMELLHWISPAGKVTQRVCVPLKPRCLEAVVLSIGYSCPSPFGSPLSFTFISSSILQVLDGIIRFDTFSFRFNKFTFTCKASSKTFRKNQKNVETMSESSHHGAKLSVDRSWRESLRNLKAELHEKENKTFQYKYATMLT
jgi:hypothetical protein